MMLTRKNTVARAGRPAAVLVAAATFCAACAGGGGSNGSRSDLVPRRNVDRRPTVQPVDTSGPVTLNDAQPGPARAAPGGGAGEREDISSTVNDAVRPVQEEGFQGVEPAPSAGARGVPNDAGADRAAPNGAPT